MFNPKTISNYACMQNAKEWVKERLIKWYESTKRRASNKTQVIVYWCIVKIFVDKIMIFFPPTIEDNVYYIAESLWLVVMFVIIWYNTTSIYTNMLMAVAVLYQLTDMFTNVYILLKYYNLNDSDVIMNCTSVVSVAFICGTFIMRYHDTKNRQDP